MTTRVALRHKYSNSAKELITHEDEHPSIEARLAIDFVSRWGQVAAVPDGEDSTGRQKLRLQEPHEIAERACRTVESLMIQFRYRNWLIQGPSLEDILGDDKNPAEEVAEMAEKVALRREAREMAKADELHKSED